MRKIFPLVIAFTLFGCAPKPAPTTSLPSPSKRPPPSPALIPTPIDNALRAQAREELDTAQKSSDEFQRAHALEEIKQFSPPDAPNIILANLTDRSPLVRKAAALATGELQIHAASTRLNELLDTSTGDDRIAIIFALHRLGDTTHSHELEQTAVDPDPRLRGDTALVLGMLGDRTSVPLLVNMLGDQSHQVRLEAAEALWKMGNDRGREGLISATISPDPEERMLALLSLAEARDTEVLGNIEGRLTDEVENVSLVAARAAGMLGSDDGYGVALQGAASDKPELRTLAAIAMGAIGRSDSQPVLKKLLTDPDPNVRLVAAGAILQIDQKN